jgi:hypothetical protein
MLLLARGGGEHRHRGDHARRAFLLRRSERRPHDAVVRVGEGACDRRSTRRGVAQQDAECLAAEYEWWWALLRADHANRGWSLVTVARDLGADTPVVQLGAAATLAVPLLGAAFVATDARFRRAFAASVLMFLVLFNHRAEYATFVVSAVGVGLWFADGPKTPARIALLALASLAHGPFLAIDDPSLTGSLAFLAAHRVYHPLRLVPLAIAWTLLQVELLSTLVSAFAVRRLAATEVRGREGIA